MSGDKIKLDCNIFIDIGLLKDKVKKFEVSKTSFDGVDDLETAKKYAEQHNRIVDLLNKYIELLNKDIGEIEQAFLNVAKQDEKLSKQYNDIFSRVSGGNYTYLEQFEE